MNKLLLILSGILSFLSLSAQKPLGTWTSYLPYARTNALAVAGNKVYCSSLGGAFYFNREDNTLNKFSREDGLSDTEISALAYSEEASTLVIAYANANIDLVKGNKIINISDIKRKQILGNKSINSIHIRGDKAYLACGFGIVLLDLARQEINETYYIAEGGDQLNIHEITTTGDMIFASSGESVYYADLNGTNLVDYNFWHRIESLPIGNFNTIASSADRVYVNRSIEGFPDEIYVLENGVWNIFPDFSSEVINQLNVFGDNLYVSTQSAISVLSPGGVEVQKYQNLNPNSVSLDELGTLWVADRNNGLVMINSSETRYLRPDGPSNIYVTSLEVEKDILVAVAGGITSGLNNLFRIGELYLFKEKEWSNWINSNIKDLINIAFDPQDPSHYYIATWGYGLLEFKDEVLLNQFQTQNSSLQSILQGDFIRIGGLAFDRDKNLWVSNSGVSEPLSVLKTDGEWQSFEIANAVNAPNIGEMIFTEDGNLWMILPGGYGLFVFNSNGTVSNEDDDEYKKLSVVDIDNSVISNFIYSIAQDRQGNIWLGTNKGIVVYYSPSRVFNSNEFYAQTILVPRNDNSGFGDPLLGTETVTAIKVDGANRKWLGTRNGGVFLVSEDGLKQIHAFNIDNSPLLSNSINDIAINENTGEVFFATNSGIISYVSDAIGPADDFSDVYVYPNPVRETYFGDIVITGLIENTFVKITDLNGNLVHETRSLGGNAIWNGNNLSGKRASTGVYLVFLTNEDGSLTHVTKLLFIH